MKVRGWVAGIVMLALVGAFVAVRAEESAAVALAVGSKAPKADVQMMSVDGKKVSVADVAGKKGTLVVFTCNACPFAKAWEDRIVDLGNTYQAKGIGVIAINSNDPSIVPDDGYEPMKERAGKVHMKFPYVVDDGSAVARAFGASRTPEAFLFDASGKLVYHGTIDDNAKEPDKVTKHYLKDALDAVATGGTVPMADTKAIGCGIKFKKA